MTVSSAASGSGRVDGPMAVVGGLAEAVQLGREHRQRRRAKRSCRRTAGADWPRRRRLLLLSCCRCLPAATNAAAGGREPPLQWPSSPDELGGQGPCRRSRPLSGGGSSGWQPEAGFEHLPAGGGELGVAAVQQAI